MNDVSTSNNIAGSKGSKRVMRAAAAATLAALVSGCAISGNAIDNAGIATTPISMAEATPTIATDPFAPREGATESDTDRLLDEDTLRLAATTADINAVPIGGLPWANAATGSTGTISNISERIVADQKCRRFDATRRAYDGVSLYRGEVCLDPRNGWWTRSLNNQNDSVQSG